MIVAAETKDLFDESSMENEWENVILRVEVKDLFLESKLREEPICKKK